MIHIFNEHLDTALLVEKKSGKNKVFFLLFFFSMLLFSLSFVYSAEIEEDLHLNIQVIASNGSVQTGTFDFAFNITTDTSCSATVYSNLTTLTTDARGIISYYLPNVTLGYDQQYYLCYYRDGSLINTSKIARTPYTFRARNITLSGVEVDTNLNATGYNITANYGFFNFLGNLANRITTIFVQSIDFSGIINGSGNLTTTGRIGIGTESPDEEFEVVGDTLISGAYQATGNEIIYAGSPLGQVKFFRPPTTNDIALYAGGSERLRINGTQGNIGINTTTPQNTLNIVGDLNVTGTIYGGTITANDSTTLDGYDSTFFMPLNTSVYGSFDFNGGWQNGGVSVQNGDIYAQTGYFYNISSLNVTQQNLSIINDLRVYGNTQLDRNLSVDSNTLFVNSDTNRVGIGTTNPNYLLEIANSSNALNVSGLLYVNGTSGNVGIGTATPNAAYILDIPTGVTRVSSFVFSALASGQVIKWNSGAGQINYTAGSTLKFNNGSSSTTMTLDQYGRVGIGTTIPSYPLDVSGTIRGTTGILPNIYANNIFEATGSNVQFNIKNNAGTTTWFHINGTTGNVGINTTTPQAALHIAGSAIINGTLDMDSGQINNLANGTSAQDAITLAQLLSVNSSAAIETDPYWSANLTANNATWNSINNATYNDAWQYARNNTFRLIDNHTFNGNVAVTNNLTVDTSDFFVNANTGYVGIGTATSTSGKLVIATPPTDPASNFAMFFTQPSYTFTADSTNTFGGTYIQPATYSPYALGTMIGDRVFSTYGGNGSIAGIQAGSFQAETSSGVNNNGSVTGMYGISGVTQHFGSGVVSDAYGMSFQVLLRNNSFGVGGNITRAYGATVQVRNLNNNTAGGKIGTGYGLLALTPETSGINGITTNYGIYIRNQATSLVTNAYGLYLDNQTGASTTNFAIYSAGGNNYFGGNVGIGTTTPQNMLNVVGNGNITGLLSFGSLASGVINTTHILDGTILAQDLAPNSVNVTHTGDIFLLNTGDTATGNYTFDTSTFFIDSTNNRVGIGTTNPGYKLEITGGDGTSTDGFVSFAPAGAGNNRRVNIGTGTGHGFIDVLTSSTGTPEELSLNPTGGNVGIGTTSPEYNLDVNGSTSTGNNVSAKLYLGRVTSASNYGYITAREASQGIVLQTKLSGGTTVDSFVADVPLSSYTGIRVDNTGDVGIGTTSPVSLLHLNGTAYTFAAGGLSFGDGDTGFYESADDTLRIQTNGSLHGYFTTSGFYGANAASFRTFVGAATSSQPTLIPNQADSDTGLSADGANTLYLVAGGTNTLNVISTGVGIGTTSPSKELDVNGSTYGDAIRLSVNSTSPIGEIWSGSTGNPDGILSLYKGISGTTERVRIRAEGDSWLNGGNVGIGTTSPQNKLNVIGDGNFTTGLVVGANFTVATNTLLVDSNQDFVGIATSSPRATLDVNGKIKLGNDAVAAQEGMLRFTGTNFEGYVNGSWVLLANATSANASASAWTENGSTVYYTGGNVGIGLTLPEKLLDLSGTTDPTIRVTDTTNTLRTVLYSGDNQGFVGTTSDHDFRIMSNNTERISITTGGLIGINTATPQNTLNVVGDANVTGLLSFGSLASGVINTTHIAADTILAADIATGGVATAEILDGTILDDDIAAGQINTTHILDSTILTADIAAAQITAALIALSSINTTHILDGTILAQDLAPNSVNVTHTGDIFLLNTGDTATGNYTFDTTTFHIDSSNDRVGIGTTTPGDLLHIATGAQGNTGERLQSSSGGFLRLQPNTASGSWNPLVTAGDSAIIFSNGTQEYGGISIAPWSASTSGIRITNTGNVGIGTATPNATLDVYKENNTAEIKLTSNDSTGAFTSGDIIAQISSIAGTSTGKYESGNIKFIAKSTNALPTTDLVFSVSNANTAPVEAMRILGANGRVGIGTDAPATELHINGTSPTIRILDDSGGTNGAIEFGSSSVVGKLYSQSGVAYLNAQNNAALRLGTDSFTSLVTLLDTGLVGINMTTPAVALEVKGIIRANSSDSGSYVQINPTGTSTAGLAFSSGDAYQQHNIQQTTAFTLTTYDGSAYRNRLTINNSRLSDANSFEFSGWNVSQVIAMVIKNSGNIGINTTTPQAALHIAGSAIINGTLDMDSGQINNLANGTSAQDAITLAQLLSVNSSAAIETDPYWSANLTANNATWNSINNATYNDAWQYARNNTFRLIDNHTFNGNVAVTNNLTVDTDTLFVNSNTNRVGIGTTSPDVSLTTMATEGTRSIGATLSPSSAAGVYLSSNSVELRRGDTSNFGLNISTDTTSGAFGATGGYIVFSPDATEAMRILVGGNVGIGTTTPDRALSVVGEVGFMKANVGNASSLYRIGVSGSNGLQIVHANTTGNGYLYLLNNSNNANTALSMNGSYSYVNALGGNLGIGTSSPNTALHVYDSTNANILTVQRGTNTSGSSIGLIFDALDSTGTRQNYAGVYGRIVSAGSGAENGSLHFFTESSGSLTEKVAILNNGNMGIGTTTPQENLHVTGNAIINGTLNMDSGQINNLANGTSAQDAITLAQLLSVNSSAAIETNWNGNFSSRTGTGNVVFSTSPSITSPTILTSIVLPASQINTTHILDSTILTGDIAAAQITAALIALSSINTTHILDGTILAQDLAPNSVNVTHTGDIFLLNTGDTATGNYTFDTTTFHIDSSANKVGIGTTAPEYNLDVYGNARVTGTTFVFGNNTDGRRKIYMYYNNQSWPFYSSSIAQTGAADEVSGTRGLVINENIGQSVSSYGIGFAINESNKMFIQYTGKVGINTTTPQNTLNVVGTANVTAPSNRGSLNVDANGNVNIGI